jgi:hypothetical protein
MHIGMQPTEIGDAGRGAHAAQKTVAFHQQGAAAHAGTGGRGGQSSGPAAQDHHIKLTKDGCVAGGFGKQCGHAGVKREAF